MTRVPTRINMTMPSDDSIGSEVLETVLMLAFGLQGPFSAWLMSRL
jgi:hypothetical protein